MKVFQARFASELASVHRARRAVAGFAAACGLIGSDVCDVELAVGEGCNNAAEHGHVSHGFFDVFCECDDATFRVEITDGGAGFEAEDKGRSIDPALRGERGLGIFIMRALMDEVTFRSDAGGTTLRLSKSLKRGARKPGNGAFQNA